MRIYSVVCIGINPTSFKAQDGSVIHGYNIYFSYPLTTDGSSGDASGRVYIGQRQFQSSGIGIGASFEVGYHQGKFVYVTY